METRKDISATHALAGDALGQLVLDHCRDQHDSLAAVARRGGMSRQTLSAIVHRTGPISMPRPETMAKLAKGLGVSLQTIERAAALAMASDSDSEESLAALRLTTLLGYAQGLADPDLDVLLATARALRLARPVA